MKRTFVAVAAVLVLLPSSAQADPPPGIDQVGKVEIGAPYEWTGSTATGLNNYYWDPAGAGDVGPFTHTTCTKQAATYCDQILVEFSNPLTQAEIDAGRKSKSKGATVAIDTFAPTEGPVTDFDLFSYESDANGTLGSQLASDGDIFNTDQETNTLSIVTTPTEPSKWVLIRVVYYQVLNGSYKGHARF